MKRKVLTILAALVVLASVAVVPAAAKTHRAVRGDLELQLNLGIVLQAGAAPEVSWFGTVDVRGAEYPIVFYGGVLEQHGDWIYYEDRWEILDSMTYELTDGVITAIERGNVIVEAEEKGWGAPSGWAYGLGRVIDADPEFDPHGALELVEAGDVALWTGRETDESGLLFAGRFRIFTGR